MRHRKHHGSLGLVSSHRRALLANMAASLITHGRIETTQAKARAVGPYVEKLITLGKRGDLHARRQVLAKLNHRDVVDRLFNDVAPVFAERAGGYTRIIKTRNRVGDAAPMAIIEFVAQAEAKEEAKAEKPAAKKEVAPVKAKAKKEAAAEDKPKEKKAAKKEAAEE